MPRASVLMEDCVLDLLFAVIFIGAPIAALVVLRSAALVAVLTAALIGASGVLMQFVALTVAPFTYRGLQLWLAVTLLVLVGIAVLMRGRSAPRLDRLSGTLIIGASALIAIGFSAARILAPGGPEPLSGVGYLVERTAAEDNAKWLNVTAQLAEGTPVDPRAAVGGPLVLVLVVTATLVSLASWILYGSVNQVAVSADSLILAEMMLVVLAPFALAPLAQIRRRWNEGRTKYRIPWPLLLLAIAILTSGIAVLLVYGHLTLQYTILVLTLWVGVFLVGYRTGRAGLLTTVAVICTAEVWFPLNVLALGLLLGLIAFAVWQVRRSQTAWNIGMLVGSVVLLVLMFDFLRSSITYALGLDGQSVVLAGGGGAGGISAAVPTLPLFASPGGTEVVTTILALLTVAAVLGAVLARGSAGATSWRALTPYAPMAALVAYAAIVMLADFWAIGYGPNYASQKLAYAVALPILATAAPVALLAIDRAKRGMTVTRWVALGAVGTLLVMDTLIPRALIQLKPALWPTAQGDPAPYWWPAEVRATGDQPLATNPIGCVYLPQDAEQPSVLIDGPRAYSCTRILIGLTGQDVAAAGLVQWELDEWLQNESLWSHFHNYLSQMDPRVRSRLVILLDEDSNVIGLDTLQSLLDRYPADELE